MASSIFVSYFLLRIFHEIAELTGSCTVKAVILKLDNHSSVIFLPPLSLLLKVKDILE